MLTKDYLGNVVGVGDWLSKESSDRPAEGRITKVTADCVIVTDLRGQPHYHQVLFATDWVKSNQIPDAAPVLVEASAGDYAFA